MCLNGVNYEGVLTASQSSDEEHHKQLNLMSPSVGVKMASMENLHTPEKSIDENINNEFKPITLPRLASFCEQSMVTS